MGYERRTVQDNLHYSDGGVTVSTTMDLDQHRVSCDQCERVSSWSPEPPHVRPDPRMHNIHTFQVPHDGFYDTAGMHLCANCYMAPEGVPEIGSHWWSRERPRHVVKVAMAGTDGVAFDVLYHCMFIGGPEELNPPRQRHGVPFDSFMRKYIRPRPDEEERRSGWCWLRYAEQESAVLRRWGGNIIVVEYKGSDWNWKPEDFLREFVPMSSSRERTWLERVIGNDDVV